MKKPRVNATEKSIDSTEKKPVIDFSKGKFFDDIDIFSITGVKEVDDKTFPSIYIEKTGRHSRKVVFRRSKEYSTVVPYQYQNEFWVGSWDERADTGSARIYQFSKPGKIIELTFLGTREKENFRLHDASIFENNRRVSYIVNRQPGFDVKAQVTSLDTIRQKHETMIEEVYVRSGRKLFVKEKTTEHLYKLPGSVSQSCYEVGVHSLIWFSHFGYYFPCRD